MTEDTQIELAELSIRDQETLREYFTNGYNGTKAWMVTHPDASYESAKANASRWLTNANVKAAIERHLETIQMSAEEAAVRLSDIARGDIAQLMDISSVGFNLDMAKAKELGLTKLIKKVRQKTTIHLAKSESDEDREVTELEIELYPADAALRDILKLHGRLGGGNSQRGNEPPGTVTLPVDTLFLIANRLESEKRDAADKARAIDVDVK